MGGVAFVPGVVRRGGGRVPERVTFGVVGSLERVALGVAGLWRKGCVRGGWLAAEVCRAQFGVPAARVTWIVLSASGAVPGCRRAPGASGHVPAWSSGCGAVLERSFSGADEWSVGTLGSTPVLGTCTGFGQSERARIPRTIAAVGFPRVDTQQAVAWYTATRVSGVIPTPASAGGALHRASLRFTAATTPVNRIETL